MEKENCEGCRWLEEFFGVCCNGDSEWCSDCPPCRCELYEEEKA